MRGDRLPTGVTYAKGRQGAVWGVCNQLRGFSSIGDTVSGGSKAHVGRSVGGKTTEAQGQKGGRSDGLRPRIWP